MHASIVPTGFTPSDLHEGFLDHVGPLFMKASSDTSQFVLAFRAEIRHANRYGVLHGGMLATLADVAIGANLARTGEGVETTLTLNLKLDYIAAGRVGDWIEAHVELTKERGRVRFGECVIRSGDQVLVRASAVFYVPLSA
ncbi:PaaI family thioesterase [Variovorax sp. J22P271]|uniref:PaaI family thioesterase n=1 Tax=Variovorax davisae TaxID=3053515 RepID=UPI0025790723|nr:PaaI family thioesterase [Variovorax sp. J22P271]MDM0035751.1 PaaI family thioesterase [Variovorax sp. J22P271]